MLPLRTMLTTAIGEVSSLEDFIAFHRRKKTRGEAWFLQQEQILQHRRQVVSLIKKEIAGRQAESEAA
ncbi:hypothetical protein [Brucella sp. IR073]|uniref:hypothetical protein n=1 Tax=unclassified Brucella TaxID=2632610 RepID=UPI003B980A0E